MIAVPLILVVAGAALVRSGWGGRRLVAGIGWGIVAGCLLMLTMLEGAWGLATGTVAGMVAALALVLHEGWRSPAKVRRPAREAPSVVLPRRAGDLARRFAVFVLVVPVAFVAAQWLAFGAQAGARRAGAEEADAIVLTLFLQPVLWGAIMAWQMTRASAVRMIALPLAAAMLGTLLWSAS